MEAPATWFSPSPQGAWVLSSLPKNNADPRDLPVPPAPPFRLRETKRTPACRRQTQVTQPETVSAPDASSLEELTMPGCGTWRAWAYKLLVPVGRWIV